MYSQMYSSWSYDMWKQSIFPQCDEYKYLILFEFSTKLLLLLLIIKSYFWVDKQHKFTEVFLINKQRIYKNITQFVLSMKFRKYTMNNYRL